jgi:deoxyribonuclease-4
MFTQSPRGWKTRVYTDEEFADFRRERERSGVTPVVVHSPYLPNLCTSDPELYQKSLDALKGDLDRCEKLGAAYLVIHPGSYSPTADLETAYGRIGAAINDAFDSVPGSSMLLIENMAGGGRRLGGPFREIAEIFKRVKNKKRIGVCFDTCHALGAGYDLSNAAGVETTLQEFDRELGLDQIKVFHVNDSKGALGSHRDLHQHLGQGNVGLEGFKMLFRSGPFENCALILETPKEPIPPSDLENLKRLRACLPQ